MSVRQSVVRVDLLGNLRLLRIETRRNVGLLFLPVLLFAAWRLAADQLGRDVLLWVDASVVVRDTLSILGPVTGGAAAWMAGRERRRGLGDLIATTARPSFSSDLGVIASTAAWGVLAYVLMGAWVLGLTALDAVWGAPVLWPLLVGLLGIATHATLGYAIGRRLPSRIGSPLAAIALSVLQTAPSFGVSGRSRQHLSPLADVEAGVYYGVLPDLGVPHTLLLGGLMGIALSSLGGRGSGGGARIALLSLGTVAAVLGAGAALASPPSPVTFYMRNESNPAKQIPHQPLCKRGHIEVCVHPAFGKELDEVSAAVERVVEPFRGVPGAPTRALQRDWTVLARPPAGTLVFDLQHGPHEGIEALPSALASHLISDQYCACDASGGFEAQQALTQWLYARTVDQGGLECGDSHGLLASPAECEAAARFEALGPERQRAWFAEHWADLRAGKIRLENLP